MWLRECVCMHVLYVGVLPHNGAAERARGGAATWRAHMAMMKLPPSSCRFLRDCARTGEGARRWTCNQPAGGRDRGVGVAADYRGRRTVHNPSPVERLQGWRWPEWGRLSNSPITALGETFPDPPPWSSSGSQGLRDWLPVALLSHARQLGIHAHMHACAHACTRTRKPTGPPAHVVSVHAYIPTYLRLHPCFIRC